MTPDHSRPAPRPYTKLVLEVRSLVRDLGYSAKEEAAFIAGAALLGHLRPGGALWYVEHVIEHTLRPAHPTDDLFETTAARAGVESNDKPANTNKPNRCS